jgi:hypothetical protein
MKKTLARLLFAGAIVFSPFAGPGSANATCPVNAGTCSGDCLVNGLANCTSTGACPVNATGTCAGHCTVNAGTCSTSGNCLINVGTCLNIGIPE